MSIEKKWRVRSQYVAYLNLVLLILLFIRCVYAAMDNVVFSVSDNGEGWIKINFYGLKIAQKVHPWALILLILVHAFVACVLAMTPVFLLEAVKPETSPEQALKYAQFWLATFSFQSLGYLVIMFYNDCAALYYSTSSIYYLEYICDFVVYFAVVITMQCTVVRFIRELKGTKESSPSYEPSAPIGCEFDV